jgi:hypothetical protein
MIYVRVYRPETLPSLSNSDRQSLLDATNIALRQTKRHSAIHLVSFSLNDALSLY